MRKTILAIAFMVVLANYCQADLVINEMLADPNGPGTADFDSNQDGEFDSSEDEYIEFVNNMTTALDISNWTVEDAVGLRHTFSAGTVLAPGQAFVLFGGGSPLASNFGGALVDVSSQGFLGLNNGGDTISVFDASTNLITSVESGTGDGVSSTRNPDLTGEFVLHDTLPGGLVGTPGFQNDGVTPFNAIPEPATLLFCIFGGLGLATVRRR